MAIERGGVEIAQAGVPGRIDHRAGLVVRHNTVQVADRRRAETDACESQRPALWGHERALRSDDRGQRATPALASISASWRSTALATMDRCARMAAAANSGSPEVMASTRRRC